MAEASRLHFLGRAVQCSGAKKNKGHTMASLFSDIQGWFEDGDYSGRYLAKLLRELARHEPQTFGRVFDLPKKYWPTEKNDIEVVLEKNYESANNFVDLALLKNGHPVLLVEIKDKDYAAKKNPDQFKRYVRFVQNFKPLQRPRLVYVSRYTLGNWFDGNAAELILLSYMLNELKKSNGVLSSMIAEYLGDIGVATYQYINQSDDVEGKALTFMTSHMLGFPHKHGLGSLHSAERINAIPNLMKKLFANLEVLGLWLKSANPSLFSKAFTRGFVSNPQYDEKTAKKISNGDDLYRCASWGWVTFYTYGALSIEKGADGKKCWANVELGYQLILESGQKSKRPDIKLYASFYWQGQDDLIAEKKILGFHPEEHGALVAFRSVLEGALLKAKKANPNAQIEAALKKFKIPPA